MTHVQRVAEGCKGVRAVTGGQAQQPSKHVWSHEEQPPVLRSSASPCSPLPPPSPPTPQPGAAAFETPLEASTDSVVRAQSAGFRVHGLGFQALDGSVVRVQPASGDGLC